MIIPRGVTLELLDILKLQSNYQIYTSAHYSVALVEKRIRERIQIFLLVHAIIA
jgi:hypothetical protein